MHVIARRPQGAEAISRRDPGLLRFARNDVGETNSQLPQLPISRIPGPLFGLCLGAIAFLGPLAVHIYMPVIPAVKAAFGLSDALAQATFSITVLGMGVATLAYGSMSDRHGRRPVLLSGLVLFVLGSVLSAAAVTVPMLIGGRIVQAL